MPVVDRGLRSLQPEERLEERDVEDLPFAGAVVLAPPEREHRHRARRERRHPVAQRAGRQRGRPIGQPLASANPDIASATVPNPGSEEYGPDWPKPVVRTITSPGFCSCSVSGPRFHRSSVPGRKLSTNTSASRRSRFASSCPAGFERSRVTQRLLRAASAHQSDSPLSIESSERSGSPRGCSILITSAPKSPISEATTGPARRVAASTTRRPLSASDIAKALCLPAIPGSAGAPRDCSSPASSGVRCRGRHALRA